MPAQPMALPAIAALSVLGPGKIAQLAVWDVVVVQEVVLSPTLAQARENIFRRPHINMSDVVGTLMW